MTIRSRYLKLLLLVTLASLALVACGSGGNDEPLPTLAPTLDTTQSELPPGVEEVSTEEATALAGDFPPGIEVDATENVDLAGPPVGDDFDGELPPGIDPNETATGEGGGLPFDESEGPPGAAGADMQLTTDFGTLASGDEVRVEGMLTVDEDLTTDPNDPYVLLTDEVGNQLRVTDLAFPVVEINRDQKTSLTGTIEDAAEEGGLMVLRSTGGIDSDSFNPSAAASGGDGLDFLDDGSPVTARIETPFVLEEDLTALAAYDALVEALDTQIEGADLMQVRGNIDLGWEFWFHRDEDALAVAYFVLPDGVVQMAPDVELVTATGDELQPIDRTEVVVDSDAAAEVLVDEADTDSPVETVPVLVLRARRDDTILWEIDGPSDATLDATTELE